MVLFRAELADGEDDGLAVREREVLCWCWRWWWEGQGGVYMYVCALSCLCCEMMGPFIYLRTLNEAMSQGGKTVWTAGARKRQRAWMWPRVQEELTMARETKAPQRP